MVLMRQRGGGLTLVLIKTEARILPALDLADTSTNSAVAITGARSVMLT